MCNNSNGCTDDLKQHPQLDPHHVTAATVTEQPPYDRNLYKANFMWGMWQSDNEITFLLDEIDVDKFPPNALILSPQKWRVIKLCGRPIKFHETGVISGMSKVEASIPSLNISSARTNSTLVPDELLELALDSLSDAMNCPIRMPVSEER